MKTIYGATFAVMLVILSTEAAFSEEEIQYKRFNLENASCDVGVTYRRSAEETEIGVSAIALGQGADFRKWNITDIRLSIGDQKIKPAEESKFYTKRESFARIPAAVLFAAIGTQVNTEGKAKGEIGGTKAIFRINKETVDKTVKGKDAIEITVENEDSHARYRIKIGIAKLPVTLKTRFDYGKMSQEELLKVIDILEGQVMVLEKNQMPYRYGTDPEYDEIQGKIEKLEAERGMAYKIWLERQNPKQN